MERQNANLLDILEHIDPARLDYQDWVNVGMGLKEAGHTADTWDAWSRRDAQRYHPGECFTKWNSFHGAERPVTAGTIVQLAKDQGWEPARADYELDWDDIIGAKDELVVLDPSWVEATEVSEPDDWNPAGQLITYLEALFEAGENVGYVTESWEKDGKYLPTRGCWDRTAGELIQALNGCKSDIGAVLGDYKPEAGAWIRFNPLDGAGCKNENVSEFRYALVESDTMDIDKQNAIIRELELPVVCLVHSGKKSLHGIVRIEAATYEEYRRRVDYLYNVCRKNGLVIDSQNRNPSRLSRMPGIMRNGKKQYIVATNIGKESFTAWQEWIESVNDDLPEPESMAEVWDNLPVLAPPLIDGVLRQGHKMLVAGPSKAGKSFALIELACAVAEGRCWLGWPCAQGRVLYVNLELDRASCLHRFKDVYQALGWKPNNLSNIDIWNLRGRSIPMDKLAPKLIRRAARKNYIAIIIDPIYKVITGDENSADQMANFCNQFDRVCTELGAAVIYCHHHSKGSQGSKRSMDRASGSGVFARDPDVLLDLIELDKPEALVNQEENRAVCDACRQVLNASVPDWEDKVGQDDMCGQSAAVAACEKLLGTDERKALSLAVETARKTVAARTAWRIDGTLREFPKFAPLNLWFDYPVHHLDDTGALKDVDPEGDAPPWQKATDKRKRQAKAQKVDKNIAFENAVDACAMDGPPTKTDIAEYLGISERSFLDRLKAHGGYRIDKNQGGAIVRKEP